jgi:hypothetical protein
LGSIAGFPGRLGFFDFFAAGEFQEVGDQLRGSAANKRLYGGGAGFGGGGGVAGGGADCARPRVRVGGEVRFPGLVNHIGAEPASLGDLAGQGRGQPGELAQLISNARQQLGLLFRERAVESRCYERCDPCIRADSCVHALRVPRKALERKSEFPELSHFFLRICCRRVKCYKMQTKGVKQGID